MKKSTGLIIISLPILHVLSFAVLILCGWVTNDTELALYLYEEIAPAVFIIWVILLIGFIADRIFKTILK